VVTEANQRFRSLLEAAPDAMVVVASDGRIAFVNSQAVELFGYSHQELIGAEVERLIPARLRERHVRHRAAFTNELRCRTMGPQLGLWALRRDGTEIPVEIRLSVVETDEGTLVSTAIRDVTDRRRAEEMLASLAAIVASAEDAIYSVSPDWRVRTWNPGAVKMFGYAAEEIVGQRIDAVLVTDIREFESIADRISRGLPVSRYETARRRKDGSLVEISLSVTPITRDGVHVGSAVIARDITESKETKRRLDQSERLASLGTLAAGIGHEINNPLAVIMAGLEYMRGHVESISASPQSDAAVALADAEEAARRVCRIVQDLRNFVRPSSGETKVLQVPDVLGVAIRMTGHIIRHHGTIVKNFGSIPAIAGDESRLMQVFTNLLINASHAIADVQGGVAEIALTTGTDPDGRAVVEVRDNGVGIEPHALSKIFDPFFTTKRDGQGTGLGLAISHSIVASMGGELTVTSARGVGSTFRVVLPAVREPDSSRAPSSTAPRPGMRGRILIIDDEAAVGRAYERILRYDDHDVTFLGSGSDAIEHLESGVSYDVILCDLMMPTVTGMDVYDAVLASRPELADRIVFMTGGTFTGRAEQFLDSTSNEHLDKPIALDALRATVQRYLTAR
jgi:PAS domain S-box-containing protein